MKRQVLHSCGFCYRDC